MHSKLPKSNHLLENVGPEANREKKTRKLKQINVEAILEAILVSSWGTWEAFGDHFGHLGANLIRFGRSVEFLGRFERSGNWFGTVWESFKTGTWVL